MPAVSIATLDITTKTARPASLITTFSPAAACYAWIRPCAISHGFKTTRHAFALIARRAQLLRPLPDLGRVLCPLPGVRSERDLVVERLVEALAAPRLGWRT